MNKELYEYFTTDNKSGKKCNEKWLSKNNEVIYKQIIDWCDSNKTLKDIEFKRKVYHFIHNQIEIPDCKVCKMEVKYRRLVQGYSDYCSESCVKKSEEYHKKWNESWKMNNSDGAHIKKRKETLKKKYGNDFKDFIKKVRTKSNLEKYGVENVFQIEKIKKKRKETLKNKYGTETFNNPDKTRITRIKNKTQLDDEQVSDFHSYKILVINRTNTIYRNNKQIINPKSKIRAKKQYHLDHIYSIKQGFKHKLPLSIITHPCNLHMIHYKENLIKQDQSWITLEELLKKIIQYETKIEVKQIHLQEEYNHVKQYASLLLEKFNRGYHDVT